MAASGINPQALLAMLNAKRGGGATGTGNAEAAVGPAATQLSSSDPAYILKTVQKMKQDIANLTPALAMKAPAAARALTSTFKGLDACIKELQQAQATLEAIGGPVNLSAIPRPQPEGGTGAPSLSMPNPPGI